MAFVVCERKGGKYKRVSQEYDAPNFCYDFIRLSGRNDLVMMVRQGRKLVEYQQALAEKNAQIEQQRSFY